MSVLDSSKMLGNTSTSYQENIRLNLTSPEMNKHDNVHVTFGIRAEGPSTGSGPPPRRTSASAEVRLPAAARFWNLKAPLYIITYYTYDHNNTTAVFKHRTLALSHVSLSTT